VRCISLSSLVGVHAKHLPDTRRNGIDLGQRRGRKSFQVSSANRCPQESSPTAPNQSSAERLDISPCANPSARDQPCTKQFQSLLRSRRASIVRRTRFCARKDRRHHPIPDPQPGVRNHTQLWSKINRPARRANLGKRRFAKADEDENVGRFQYRTPGTLVGALVWGLVMNQGCATNSA
jgi:hypothetical protein